MSKRGKRFLMAFLAGLFLIALALLGMWLFRAKMPEDPKVEAISLVIPKDKHPVDAGFQKILTSIPENSDEKAMTAWSKAFQHAFFASGCSPKVDIKEQLQPKKDPKKPSFSFALLQGLRFLHKQLEQSLRQDDPERAAEQTTKVLQKLSAYRQSCPRSLVDVMIWIAMEDKFRTLTLALFEHPKLTLKTRHALLAQIRRHAEQDISPLVNAFRHESAFQLAAFAHTANPKNLPDNEIPLMMWPFWDAEMVRSWTERYWKLMIYRIRQPKLAALWEETPSSRFFEKEFEKKSALSYFRYNAVGYILFGIAQPSFHRFVYRYHQARCLFAATHQALRESLAKMPRSADPNEKPVSLPAALLNPLTNKPFGDLNQPLCAILSPQGEVEAKGKPLRGEKKSKAKKKSETKKESKIKK